MGAFGTIAIEIFPFIAMLFDGGGEHLLGLVDLHADLGQIGQFHRRAILVDQCFNIEPVKLKIIVFYFKTFLGKIEGLLYQVGVRIVH